MALSMVSLQRPLLSSCCGRNPRPCQLTWPPIMNSSSWQALGYSSPQIPSELAGGDSFYLQFLKRQMVIKIDEVTVLSPADSINKKVGILISELTEKT